MKGRGTHAEGKHAGTAEQQTGKPGRLPDSGGYQGKHVNTEGGKHR